MIKIRIEADPGELEKSKLGEILDALAKHGVVPTSDELSKSDDDKTCRPPPAVLEAGIQAELEHTDDRGLAQQLAMEHLSEDPTYYAGLEKVEKSANPPQGATGHGTGGKFNASAQLQTHMGNRNVHTGGATNIAFHIPAGPSANTPVDHGYMEAARERANRTVHNQRELYRDEILQLRSPQALPLVPVKLPQDKIDADEEARNGADERKGNIDRYAARRYANSMAAPTRLLDGEVTAKYYINVDKPTAASEPEIKSGRTGPS